MTNVRNRLMHFLARAIRTLPPSHSFPPPITTHTHTYIFIYIYIYTHIHTCTYVHTYSDLKFRGRATHPRAREAGRLEAWLFRYAEKILTPAESSATPPRKSLFIGRSEYGTSYLGSSSRTLARCRTFTTGVFEDRGESTAALPDNLFLL